MVLRTISVRKIRRPLLFNKTLKVSSWSETHCKTRWNLLQNRWPNPWGTPPADLHGSGLCAWLLWISPPGSKAHLKESAFIICGLNPMDFLCTEKTSPSMMKSLRHTMACFLYFASFSWKSSVSLKYLVLPPSFSKLVKKLANPFILLIESWFSQPLHRPTQMEP